MVVWSLKLNWRQIKRVIMINQSSSCFYKIYFRKNNQYFILPDFLSSQPEGADLADDGVLGSGESHPGPAAGPQDVQPPQKTVWQHRRAAASHEEDLHHQCRLCAGHHQPAGLTRSDQIAALRPYGKGGGEADDWWTRVGSAPQVPSTFHFQHF